MTKNKTHIEYLFGQINGGDCVDSAEEAQEIAEELLAALREVLKFPADFAKRKAGVKKALEAIARAEGNR